MTEKLKTLFILFASILIFIVGIAGLFLPVIPGLVLIAFSLFLLSTRFDFVKKWLEFFGKRYPKVEERIKSWRKRNGGA